MTARLAGRSLWLDDLARLDRHINEVAEEIGAIYRRASAPGVSWCVVDDRDGLLALQRELELAYERRRALLAARDWGLEPWTR